MRTVMLLIALVVAGGAVWMLYGRSDAPQGDVEYQFDVLTNEVIPVEPLRGTPELGNVEAVGVVGEVSRPRRLLGNPDRWMSAELRLPQHDAVTGKELLAAMGRLAPIRFRTATELARFEAVRFDLDMDEDDLVHGMMFEGWVTHAGFSMEARPHFIFVYDKENDDAFAREMAKRRKRPAAASPSTPDANAERPK